MRATVISMSGQVDAIGQIASGPLAGVVSLWSIQAAIAFASFLITPALPQQQFRVVGRIVDDEDAQLATHPCDFASQTRCGCMLNM